MSLTIPEKLLAVVVGLLEIALDTRRGVKSFRVVLGVR